jgi:hypothetical protein
MYERLGFVRVPDRDVTFDLDGRDESFVLFAYELDLGTREHATG